MFCWHTDYDQRMRYDVFTFIGKHPIKLDSQSIAQS